MKLSWKTCLRAGVTVFALFLCIHYWPTLSGLLILGLQAARPVLLGCAAAFVLNIPMRAYERHYFPKSDRPLVKKSRRPVCLLLAFLSVAAVLVLLLRLVVPELVSCVTLLVSRLPGVLEDVVAWLTTRASWLSPEVVDYLNGLDWQQIIGRVGGMALSGFGSVANLAANFVTSVLSGAVTTLLVLIFAIYVLLGKERLGRQIKTLGRRYLKREWWSGLRHVTAVVQDSFHDYIVGQCTEAVILGCLCAAGMLLFRFPYAAVVGATVGLTALIPVAGAYIGGAVGFLLILTVSPIRALLFVLYLVILQQLENNIIYPKVVGTSLGLPGIWVLCAVIVGGGVLGILGMILGVPLAAAAYRLIKEDVARGKRDRRPLPDDED